MQYMSQVMRFPQSLTLTFCDGKKAEHFFESEAVLQFPDKTPKQSGNTCGGNRKRLVAGNIVRPKRIVKVVDKATRRTSPINYQSECHENVSTALFVYSRFR